MAPPPTLPRPLDVFGDAWGSIVDKCHARMDVEPQQTRRAKDMLDVVERHLDRYLDESQQFIAESESLFNILSEQLAQEAADTVDLESAIHRAAARVELCPDRFLIGYNELLRVKPGPLDAGWSILCDAYRDTLLDIRDMLDDEHEFLADPVTYNRFRGLPTTKQLNHTVDLRFRLITSEEIDARHDWASDPAGDTGFRFMWRSALLTLFGIYTLSALVVWWWRDEITSPIGMVLLFCIAVAWIWGAFSPVSESRIEVDDLAGVSDPRG